MPLKVSDGIAAWIKDFKKSDAPQFKGKSEKERRDQAIAAYLSAKRGPQNEDYGAMKDAEAHAKRDGKNYNDVSVQHKYDAYHMKKRGYTHFTPSRYGGRTYHKGSAGYDSEKIEPHHYSGISEAWETIAVGGLDRVIVPGDHNDFASGGRAARVAAELDKLIP